MGKNYENTYKRTYEGDYTKKYQDDKLVKEMRIERKRDYAQVSKKLGSTHYNRSEKGYVYTNQQGGAVNASGPASSMTRRNASEAFVSTRRAAAKPEPKKPAPAQTATVTAEKQTASQSSTPVSRPRAAEMEKPKPMEKAEPIAKSKRKGMQGGNKYSYIKIDTVEPPVRRILGSDKYEDIYTGDIVTERGAVERLEYVGYVKKGEMDNVPFFFLSLLALLVPFIGPLVLMGIGNSTKKKQMIDYEKMIGARSLVFSVNASTEDIEGFKKRGNICTGLGTAFLFMQYYFFVK